MSSNALALIVLALLWLVASKDITNKDNLTSLAMHKAWELHVTLLFVLIRCFHITQKSPLTDKEKTFAYERQ